MVRFDIITLTSPMLTRNELQQLCDEISKLRSACERLADEIDVITARKIKNCSFELLISKFLFVAPRSPATSSPSRPQRPHPPIPSALRCLSLQQSPFHSQLPPFDQPSRFNSSPAQPPSYSEVMRETGRTSVTNSLPNLAGQDDSAEGWSCQLCTFLNFPLLVRRTRQ